MPRSATLILFGSLAAIAIGALSVFALEAERGHLDRSAMANLAGASPEPSVTGSITPRGNTGAPYRKRVGVLDKVQLKSLSHAVGAPVR